MIKWMKLEEKHPKDKKPKKPIRCLVWIKETGFPKGHFDYGAYSPASNVWFVVGSLGPLKDKDILFWSELNEPKDI
jgi:hypothetical protein